MRTSQLSFWPGNNGVSSRTLDVHIQNRRLPIWTSQDLSAADRMDNNFFAAAYAEACDRLQQLPGVQLMTLDQLAATIKTGSTGEGDEIPVIEGLNILPNCIRPRFVKFADRQGALLAKKTDLLILKDGSPAVVAAVTQPFLEACGDVAAGTHVYVVSLRDEYGAWAAYISCWLNSTYGQAILRRYIAGSVSPTLRRDDLKEVLVPIPKDETLAGECQQWVEDLQQQLLESSKFMYPSEQVMKLLGSEPPLPYLPLNWTGGGKHDPHGYYRDTPTKPFTDTVILPRLPVWISHSIPEDRLDNNYFHPAFDIAKQWISSLGLPVHTIGQMCETIFTGATPKEVGEVAVVEGVHFNPNCLFPGLAKFTDDRDSLLQDYDILVLRSGTPCMVAVLLPSFHKIYGELAPSDHVHAVRLTDDFKTYAPYICAFLNSRVGQALVRRYITSGIIPTLNRRDLVRIPIPLPTDENIIQTSRKLLEDLQTSLLRSALSVDPSDQLLQRLGLTEPLPYLPVNWMPGGKRDPQGYYQRIA